MRHHMRTSPFLTRERGALLALLAIVGPGLLAGVSDDDPAGITTYSILGADFGYTLLWVLLLSTGALILFHGLAMRMGMATGKGLVAVIRDRYGRRPAWLSAAFLIVANLGTTAAELAGIAAGLQIAGVPLHVSVPIAAVTVSVLVIAGSFHRVEHVLLAVSAIFVTYIASGLLSHPSWGKVGKGLVIPNLPSDRHAVLVATATLGTTLAPWGLAFIQSYTADKQLKPKDWSLSRIDIATGAVLTGVIGLFVVIATTETLYRNHRHINDARDAAVALAPLAGHLASTLFAIGLVGAGMLAAAILPLSTAYSVAESFGHAGKLDGKLRTEPIFYGTFVGVTVAAAGLVMIPGAPLVRILFLTQALNAVMLLPLLAMIIYLCRDSDTMGSLTIGRVTTALSWATFALIAAAVVALGVYSL
jgi:Mn2+/Fe2+ NRAMP family transporter